jgi:hypothetical protein
MQEKIKDTLMECFSLFRDNETYSFYGYDEEEGKSIIGKYNRQKINPREPDLRLYYTGEEKEFLSLWVKIGKTGRKYLIGNKNGFHYVGLINFNPLDESEPYLKIFIVIKGVSKNE